MDNKLKITAKSRLDACFEQAVDAIGHDFIMPSLTFNQRGKIAGSAVLQKNLIKLNPVLFNDNVNEFLAEVIPHELAHILVYQRFGKVKPHGIEWQRMMVDVFNIKPDVKHTLDVSKVQGKMFDYVCSCGSVKLSVRRHNKVVRGKQQYQCMKCRELLKYSNAKTNFW